MFTRYVQSCDWCYKSFYSIYKNEVICQSCDSKLIDLEHDIYYCAESQELTLNGYSIKDIQNIISKDMNYLAAFKTLRKECGKLIDNF